MDTGSNPVISIQGIIQVWMLVSDVLVTDVRGTTVTGRGVNVVENGY